MDNLKFIGIIPARYASTRFPGKPLAMMGGMTMIERVYRQALKELDEVWVATDDRRISDAVEKFGGKAVMTSVAHRSGTDRCLEAYDNIGSDADVVINIQGDEPVINPMQIRQIKECFNQVDTQIATLVRVFEATKGYAALENPNTPKVVIGDAGIESVELTGDGETPALGGEALKTLAPAFKEAGSADVDAVAGATVSSDAAKKAVQAALDQAK